ncbi:GNAT family N-acetyltransferase [Shewanella intestini]|uniref:GNAT family N-acetyltransferase n=1 Tax=Shewanella intestini TaxID=2017544 RepID=A0ABS5I2L1_9GAMM|nr:MULTISPECIES: GNAT family N-acetyltransferase [Shewanella]MBR9728258.1 GNAT family N-acetyltransferase [Shewanella intestini]MRG35723.1 GNAT family N-acetyltransferase [Shewanella sp. XMDDZSB0408]
MISLFYTLFTIIAYQPTHAQAISLLFHQAVQQINHPRYPQAKLNVWSAAPRSATYWHNVSKALLMKGQRLPNTIQAGNKSAPNMLNDNERPNHLPRRKKIGRSGVTWVALDGQHQLCGFINLAIDFNQQGYINHLYVAPQFSGQGIATQLLMYAQQWALEQGFLQLTVDASYLSKALFLKAGFDIIQTSFQHKQQVTLNGFYMRKALHR